MKSLKNIIKTTLILTFLISLQVSFYSCKKIPNPNGDLINKDTITYNLLKTSIFIQFIDANTNELIIPDPDKEIKIRIVGKSSKGIADIIGTQKQEYTIKNSFITFAVLPEAEFIPSATSPISFTVIAELPNYITIAKEITLTSEGDYIIKIPMVNLADSPESITTKQYFNEGVLVKGVLQQDLIFTTDDNTAIVKINAGTKLLTSDSTELAGSLNAVLTYYNSVNDKSLSVIPGGITASILDDYGTSSGVFFPAGVLTLDIYDTDWHKAAIVEDDSLNVAVKLSSQSYNPLTDLTISVGDSIPYYSYLADTGMWKFNAWANITDTIFGQLYSSIKVTTLTSVNLSYFKENGCNSRAHFRFSGECTQCSSVMVDGVVRKQDDNTYVSSITRPSGGDSIPTASLIATGSTPVYIEWGQNTECNNCYVAPNISPQIISDMCLSPLLELPIVDDGSTTISIDASFSGVCESDTNVVILPSFGLWIKPINSTCWRWTSMKNGKAKICNVIYGDTYVLGTYYDGAWKEWEIQISTETSYDFSLDFSNYVCTNVFGIL